MSSRQEKNQRRNVLSDPKSQLRLIMFFMILAVVYALLNFYISKRAFGAMASDVQALSMPTQAESDIAIMISSHERALNLQLSVFAVLMGAMLVMAAIAVSHRVGGPMTHLRIYMRGVMNGTVEPRKIRFRKKDFFQDVAGLFNEFQVDRVESYWLEMYGDGPPAKAEPNPVIERQRIDQHQGGLKQSQDAKDA